VQQGADGPSAVDESQRVDGVPEPRVEVPGDNPASVQERPADGMLRRVALYPSGKLSVLTTFCKTVLRHAPAHVKAVFPTQQPDELILKLFGDWGV